MEVKAKVKNQAGSLVLDGRYLLWKTDTGSSQTVDLGTVSGMKATPPTAASCRILLSGSSGPILKLDFANRDSLDVAKEAIQQAIQATRQGNGNDGANSSASGTPHTAPQAEAPAATPASTATPTPTGPPRKKQKKTQISLEPAKLLANFELQRSALDQDQALKKTFQETVMSGLITNEQFWSMRLDLLVTSAQSTHQSRGAYNVLSTIKPVTGSDNQINLSLTRDKIHDIFEQYPIVRKAYNDNVPDVSEGEFWQKFFMSRFFLHLRGERISKNHPWDPLLDKYIDILEESIKKRNAANANNPSVFVPMYLDVEGNSNDVSDCSNAPPDPTMRLGTTDNYGMGLIRQFNGLSKRLVSGAKASAATPAARDLKKYDAELADQIKLADLEPPSTRGESIKLHLKSSTNTNRTINADFLECTKRLVAQLGRDLDLSEQVEYDDPALAFAQTSIMTLSAEKSRQSDSSLSTQTLLDDREVMLCHATGLEFLRHFWGAKLKNEPLDTFIPCLEKSLQRIAAVVSNVAAAEALQPLKESLERALAY